MSNESFDVAAMVVHEELVSKPIAGSPVATIRHLETTSKPAAIGTATWLLHDGCSHSAQRWNAVKNRFDDMHVLRTTMVDSDMCLEMTPRWCRWKVCARRAGATLAAQCHDTSGMAGEEVRLCAETRTVMIVKDAPVRRNVKDDDHVDVGAFVKIHPERNKATVRARETDQPSPRVEARRPLTIDHRHNLNFKVAAAVRSGKDTAPQTAGVRRDMFSRVPTD